MGCGCLKLKPNETYLLKKDIKNEKIKPFDTCPLCAFKHLSYALILLNNYEESRAIAQIYLAYKHLEKVFIEEAKQCFQIVENYFNPHVDINDLELLINQVKNLTTMKSEKEEQKPLNLENTLNYHHKSILYIFAAAELYNYEIGYRDVNTPYVFGFLQKSTENLDDENLVLIIRDIWKRIENHDRIDYIDFQEIATIILNNSF